MQLDNHDIKNIANTTDWGAKRRECLPISLSLPCFDLLSSLLLRRVRCESINGMVDVVVKRLVALHVRRICQHAAGTGACVSHEWRSNFQLGQGGVQEQHASVTTRSETVGTCVSCVRPNLCRLAGGRDAAPQ